MLPSSNIAHVKVSMSSLVVGKVILPSAVGSIYPQALAEVETGTRIVVDHHGIARGRAIPQRRGGEGYETNAHQSTPSTKIICHIDI